MSSAASPGPLDPSVLVHYLAACTVARLSPATISSTFRSMCDVRELMLEISTLAIPDAAACLRRRYA